MATTSLERGSPKPAEFEEKQPELTITEDVPRKIADGGARAWMSVGGGWLVAFCTFGYAQSFGVFEDLYTLSGASTPSNIAWIGSFQLFMMFAMALPAGKLFDSGYFHHLEIVGGLLFVFSVFMLSLADPSKYYQIFLSQGLGIGIGCGMMFLPVLSVQAHHWDKYRAMAMGLVLTGSSAGGIIFPIMHNHLFHSSAGFAWGVRASGFLLLGLLVAANLLLSTAAPPKRNAPKPKISEVFGNIPYILGSVGCFFVLLGLYFPYFFLQLYVDVHGLSPNLATYTLAILNAASIFGRTIPNVIADKHGKFNVILPISFIGGCLIFAMLGLKNTGGVVVFGILYGFTSGAFISLVPPLISVFVGNVSEIGIYLGLGLFVASWANLVGTPITGRLLGTTTFVWWRPIVFSGVLQLAGCAFLAVSRSMMVKRRGTRRI